VVISVSRFFLLLCLLLSSGCKSEIALDEKIFPKIYELEIYQKGRLVSSHSIKSEHNINIIIQKWFLNNLNGWVVDMNTYAPQVILLSNSLNINFIFDSGMVIVNYMDLNNKRKQVSKNLNINDSEILIKSLKSFQAP
jgi:hypothetical protein